jgi:phosphoribosylaminoimidazolecarboxamide formyltransferase / IMP cyclohydrolase
LEVVDGVEMRCCARLQSNAITVAKDMRLLGMGSGQPNRVNSVRIALEKAADKVKVTHHEFDV